jgi:hypothetical protein
MHRGTDTQRADARQGTQRRNPLKNTASSVVFAAAANAAFQDNSNFIISNFNG